MTPCSMGRRGRREPKITGKITGTMRKAANERLHVACSPLWLILMDRVLARLHLNFSAVWQGEGLGGLDVCSLLALGASGDVKRYTLAFLEGFEAAGVDCRVMREEVLATVFRGDEAKAFCVVKPFHCSACHFDAPDWGRYFATHT